MTQKRCPACGSTNVRHEVEHDDDGNEAAAYWVCQECGEGWTSAEDLERRADNE
jgi:transposase-like protein